MNNGQNGDRRRTARPQDGNGRGAKRDISEMSSKKSGNKSRIPKSLKVVSITAAVIAGFLLLLFILKEAGLFSAIIDSMKPKQPASVGYVPPTDPAAESDDANLTDVRLDEDIYNFLIVGHDRAANLCDVSLLINFNAADQTLRVMQLPRDTYVDYDGYWYHKMNGVFNYYKDDSAENPDFEGIKGYADFVGKNLGMPIHYYGIMDLDQFVNIVDALGGVEMDVPQDMYYTDPYQNLTINIKAGKQTLNGKQAEQVVRYRATYAQGDIGRGNMQKLFMASLFDTLKNKMGLLNFTKICGIISENLVTNLSTTDMIYFADKLAGVALKNVIFITIPGNSAPGTDGLSYYHINRAATLDIISTYFNYSGAGITDENFDPDRIFDDGGTIYSAPKEKALEYVYSAAGLVSGEETPKT